MKATFYDNSDGAKDEFTIEKSGNTLSMAANDAARTAEDKPIDIDVLTNDKNVNGLPLMTLASNTDLPMTINLEGNGPTHGTARVNNDKKTITYFPSADYSGLDSFTYTVSPTNNHGIQSDPARVSVTVNSVNDPPHANNDNASSSSNSEDILINVLANDIDPDGDSLRVIETSHPLLNDSSILVNNDGTISYSAPNDFNGVDSFSYTISDDNNETATASVKINVNNNLSFLNTNTTNVIITNGTENSSGLIVNSSRVNSNTSGSVFVGTPFNNNKFNLLNVTEDSIVISNESESDKATEQSDASFREASQVSPKTNSSLQIDSEGTHDAIRNKAIKLAAEMAKGALDKAEQALGVNENIDPGNTVLNHSTIFSSNLPEASDVTVHSGQSVNHGDVNQGHSDFVRAYDDLKARTKDRLAQQAEMVIDKAQKNLDNKSGSTEVTENLNHDPDRPDASKILNSHSPQIGDANSKTETDNFATENHPHTYPTNENNALSQTGKSDIHSPRSAIVSKDSHSVGKTDLKADAGDNQKVIEGAKVTLDGTGSKIADHSGLSYSWKQVNGPKVRISDVNSAIASFQAPKVPSEQDKITLKFVLVITEDSESTNAKSNKNNNNNDKDSITVTVEQEPSLGNRVSHEPSNSNNNNNNNIIITRIGHRVSTKA